MGIKKISICFALSLVSVFMTSQENNEKEESIAIPDVSTAIDLESASIEEDAIPDFTQILPVTETDFLLTLDLPEISGALDIPVEEEDKKQNDEFFFIEGVVGGGFPGFFLGDLFLTGYNKTNPFSIQFSHFSQTGLGSHRASDGYTQSNTSLSGETAIHFNDMYSLKVKSGYEQASVGLQNKSPLFYQSVHNGINGKAMFSVEFPSLWHIHMSVGGEWANRYLGLLNENVTMEQESGIYYDTNVGFSFGKDLSRIDFDVLTEYQYSMLDKLYAHRVFLNANIESYLTEELLLGGDIGLLYEKNVSVPVLLPFSIFIDYNTSSLDINFSLGMSSTQVDYANIQKKYPFAMFPQTIHEEATWFSNFALTLPLLENSTLQAGINLEKTAFNQGVFQPTYDVDFGNLQSGLYPMQICDVFQLKTNIAFGSNYGIFGLLTGWNASWLDVLVDEHEHELYVSASAISKDNFFGAQLTLTETLFEDYIPILDLTLFINATSAITVELQVEDFVKLVTGKDRMFAGEYVTDTGYIGLFAKIKL